MICVQRFFVGHFDRLHFNFYLLLFIWIDRDTLKFIINGRGGGGSVGFKDFEKLLNGGGSK